MKKIITFLILIFFVFPGTLSADEQYTPLTKDQILTIIPSNTRYIESLCYQWEKSYSSGQWESDAINPYDDYLEENVRARRFIPAQWEKSTDGLNWKKSKLPFSRSSMSKVYYKRTIKIDRKLRNRLNWNLYLMGIDHQVEIYMNEQFVGKYIANMTSINVEIPDKLIVDGSNVIQLVILPPDNIARQIRTQNLYANKSYTGIIREAFLVGKQKVWLNNFKINTEFGENYSTARINTSVDVSSGHIKGDFFSTVPKDDTTGNAPEYTPSESTFILNANLYDKSTGLIVAQTGDIPLTIESERTVSKSFALEIAEPKLWSTKNPNLYELKVKVSTAGNVIDSYDKLVGLREIEIAKNEAKIVMLNGRPIHLKGIVYIEDIYPTGSTVTAEKMEEDIKSLKNLGANLVRIKYYPPHPYFVHLCNIYGILIMAELPVYDVPDVLLNTDEIRVQMNNLANLYVDTYDNEPSIMAWGISDGVKDSTRKSNGFAELMINRFKESSNKLIYKIINENSGVTETDGFDLIGIELNNESRPISIISDNIKRFASFIDLPVFITYGMPVQPKNHNGYSDPLSLEHQAHYIKNIYNALKDMDFVVGSVISSYNDYLLENPLLIANNDNQFLYTIGLVSRDRQARLAYKVVKALFNNENEPLLHVGSYSEKTPVSFIIFGIAIGIVLIFMVNRFRRFREYIFRSVLRPYNFYADIRDQRIMSSIQTFILGILIAMTIGIFIASILFYYRNSELAQYFLTLVIPFKPVQKLLFDVIWMPEVNLGLITILYFAFAFIIALVMRFFAFFMRARIFYADTLTITIWSGIPFLILLPISIVLIRILVISPISIWVFIIVFLFITLWVLGRILKSASVVYDRKRLKVYLTGLIIIIVVIGVPLAIFQYNYSIVPYTQYFLDVMLNLL